MADKAFLQDIRTEIAAIFNPTTPITISRTLSVPNVEDSGFTLAAGETHRAKTIETCVLFIDIRNSTQLNFTHSSAELAKLYSAFVVTMLRGAEYYGGYVRNINGDRVMVVFDAADCFYNALMTATLLNTIANHLLNTYFTGSDFACGIGIDYGSMLVVKTGTIKRGKENQFYKSFVWLGKPANLASKLTDLAGKDTYVIRVARRVLNLIRKPGSLVNYTKRTADFSIDEFIEKLTKATEQDLLRHEGKLVYSFAKQPLSKHAILLTQEVYEGLRAQHPTCEFFTKRLLEASSVRVKGYTGQVYGTDAFFLAVQQTR